MAVISPALVDIATRHAVFLESLKASDLKAYAKFLEEMVAVIKKRLAGEMLTDFSRGRLAQLQLLIASDLSVIAAEVKRTLFDQARSLAEYEAGFEARSLAEVVSYEFSVPSAQMLQQAVFATPLSQISGVYGNFMLESFINDWAGLLVNTVQSTVSAGYYAGDTTQTILQRLIGTKRANYVDGKLSKVYRDMESVVRTSLQHTAMQARKATWESNSDIVKGWRFVATLDTRTTTVCRATDGQIFAIGKGPLPPLHPRCRSTAVPALDGRFGVLQQGGTRAARDPATGKREDAPAGQTYYGWLKAQDAIFVESVLGKDRAKLFLSGGLSAEKFRALQLDKYFVPRTLAEIATLEPLAFRRAGLTNYFK